MKIAAPWPSSRYLADAMSMMISVPPSGIVVELGAGTGAVTRSLLNQGIAEEQLYIIEADSVLAGILSGYYPEATVINGDASNIDELLAQRGVQRVAAVISSLPMLIIPELIQLAILQKSFTMLEKDGIFVQYTYGTRSPIADRVRRQLGITGNVSKSVWRNLPPARVWSYRHNQAPVMPLVRAVG